MGIVVLEGANCIGKSTTCKYLENAGFQYIHFPSSSTDLKKGNISKWIASQREYDPTWGDMFRNESTDSIYRHGYAKLDILTNLKAIIKVSKVKDVVIDRMSLSNSLYNNGSDKMQFTDMIYRILIENNVDFKTIVMYTNNPAVLKKRLMARDKDCEYTKKNIEFINKTNTYINTMYKSLPERSYIEKVCVDDLEPYEVYMTIMLL